MHGRKCAAFQHGWCRPCWTARSLEENWQIPKYFLLLSCQCNDPPRIHNWPGKHWHCAHLVSSLKCALSCTVAGNQKQRGITGSYLPVAGCGGAVRIQLRVSVRRAVKVLIPLMMATPWLTCARAQGMQTCG